MKLHQKAKLLAENIQSKQMLNSLTVDEAKLLLFQNSKLKSIIPEAAWDGLNFNGKDLSELAENQ